MPSGFRSSTAPALVLAGITSTWQPSPLRQRRMFCLIPESKAMTLNRGAGGVV
jgi:hypothetical protein